MRKKTFFFSTYLALGFLILILSSCATRVALQVQRTPNLDTAGIRRIAIMPFTGDQSAAAHATNVAANNIRATNHFTLVDHAAVKAAGRRGESIENYVDALFKGEVRRVAGGEAVPQQSQYKNRETGEMVTRTYYVMQVEVELAYFFSRARDGTIIGPLVRSGSASASAESQDGLSAGALVMKAVESCLASIYRDVAPYTITVSRPMEKEPNEALKPQMEAALAHVKGGNYVAARKAYLAVWESHNSVAAAVNASVLYEAMGETREAADFMQNVVAATGSPLARDALARLNRELGEKAGVEQFADTRSQAQKAASHAVSEIRKVLPMERPKLLILNNAASNQGLAANVVDDMVSAFSKSGVPVVERQMIDAAIKEQEFQMGGNVSDEDIVSIGNFAGANAIVVVGITGAGAGRRLQIRVLDIETGTVLLQSNPGSEWHL